MIRYFINRILVIALIVLCVIFILFALLYQLPGSHIRLMSMHGNGDSLDSIYAALNVRDCLFTKYLRYCYNTFFHLNVARSITAGDRMLSLRILTTLIILVCGLSATLLIGVPLGIYTAMRKNKASDHVINVILQLLSSLPSYIVAVIILLFFASYLKIIPVIIYPKTPLSFFMPALTITVGGASSVARMTKVNLLDVLDQPFITALRAKGLRRKSVIYHHALKNALIPIMSFLRGFCSQLLCGTLVVERFFSLPGVGSYMLNAVSTRNHIEILGCTVVMTVVLALMNIATDVLYAFINPLIRLSHINRSGYSAV